MTWSVKRKLSALCARGESFVFFPPFQNFTFMIVGSIKEDLSIEKRISITPEIAKELKEGSISFMVYAYPPARNKMAQDDGKDGGNAFQKRREAMASESQIGGDLEAKVLGLGNADDNLVVTE